MTRRLPIVKEWHTSDFKPCARSVYHRRLGEESMVVTQALYKGIVAAGAMEYMHGQPVDTWHDPGVIAAAMMFGDAVMRKEIDGGRVLSPSVEREEAEHVEAVRRVVTRYAVRLGPMFEECEIIGTEVPVFLELTDDEFLKGEVVPFSSHVDLILRDTKNVFRRGAGRLLIPDHKLREDPPSYEGMARDPQLFVYQLAALDGSFEIQTEFGPVWTAFNEWADVGIIDLTSLKPYARKTSRKVRTKDGHRTVEFAKGDDRPLDVILVWGGYRRDRADVMRRQLAERVVMMRSGLYPAAPTVQGCRFCPSEAWCPRADVSRVDQQQEIIE